jgi:hypothetical protein
VPPCESNSLSLATVNSSAGLYRISMAVYGAGGSFSIHYDDASSIVTLTISLPLEMIYSSHVDQSAMSKPNKSDAVLPSSKDSVHSSHYSDRENTTASSVSSVRTLEGVIVPSSGSNSSEEEEVKGKRKADDVDGDGKDETDNKSDKKRTKFHVEGFPQGIKVCAIDDSQVRLYACVCVCVCMYVCTPSSSS